jgi:hypothetical protein
MREKSRKQEDEHNEHLRKEERVENKQHLQAQRRVLDQVIRHLVHIMAQAVGQLSQGERDLSQRCFVTVVGGQKSSSKPQRIGSGHARPQAG